MGIVTKTCIACEDYPVAPNDPCGLCGRKAQTDEEFAAEVEAFDCGPQEEIDALRAFAKAVMECWPMGDLDGGDLQEIAVKHGMLKPETRHEPCGEACYCNEYADAQEWTGGVVCYRKTLLLKGSNV